LFIAPEKAELGTETCIEILLQSSDEINLKTIFHVRLAKNGVKDEAPNA
jgi:hypothetical protein